MQSFQVFFAHSEYFFVHHVFDEGKQLIFKYILLLFNAIILLRFLIKLRLQTRSFKTFKNFLGEHLIIQENLYFPHDLLLKHVYFAISYFYHEFGFERYFCFLIKCWLFILTKSHLQIFISLISLRCLIRIPSYSFIFLLL